MISSVTSGSVTIPMIDLDPFVMGDRGGQQQVAQDIYQACHRFGFMYLKHYGIDPELVQRVFQLSQELFSLPIAEKQQLAYPDQVSNRGYAGLERERLNPHQPGDLKETFNIGLEREPTDLPAALTQNRWIPGNERFRALLLEFFDACSQTANHVFRAFALALDLPESFVVDRHRQREHTLRLLHYPPLPAQPKPGQVRAGEHSDYGSLTLLFQDNVGGLEVQTVAGEWVPAPYIPATVLVNTGDLMQRWSNDIFRSTRHRVALPTHDQAARSRYAIAYFCQPDHNAEIACLSNCYSREHPPKYAPIQAGDYLLSLLQATY